PLSALNHFTVPVAIDETPPPLLGNGQRRRVVRIRYSLGRTGTVAACRPARPGSASEPQLCDNGVCVDLAGVVEAASDRRVHTPEGALMQGTMLCSTARRAAASFAPSTRNGSR